MGDDQGHDVSDTADEPNRGHSAVRLPGFVNDEDIGFGDLMKRVTATAGIRPCRGCERRAEALDRWITIVGKGNRKR
ncbi:hypothetical protein ABZV91_00510 [Nocardia sp. NPDC004568]|uniref:hypothetical protein n=1 Tax=Nocardia sp. NPDC004568 TaxID=3154551 RepID=UPI0033AF07CE